METMTICGVEYVTDSALSGGDYGGCGYLARVNCEELEKAAIEAGFGDHIMGSGFSEYGLERDVQQELDAGCDAPVLIQQSGSYGSVGALVRADVAELVELVESLGDYPVLSDEALSEAEMELEAEAWNNYIASDLRDEILKAADADGDEELYEAAENFIDEADGDLIAEWFRDGCDAQNVYPEFEGDGGVYYCGLPEVGAYVWETHLRPAVEAQILDALDSPEAAIRRAQRDGLIAPLFTAEGGAV